MGSDEKLEREEKTEKLKMDYDLEMKRLKIQESANNFYRLKNLIMRVK